MSRAGHNSKPGGPVNADKLIAFADRMKNLRDEFKADMDTLLEDAEKASIDKAALRRLAAWEAQDHVKRAEREAIDDQYRFLAGKRATPGVLPVEGMLSKAVGLYAGGAKVRTVAETLKVSTGKAHALKTQAAAFLVHVQMNVNSEPEHDPETGEIETPAQAVAGAGEEARLSNDSLGTSPAFIAEHLDPGPIPDFLRRVR